MINKMSNLSKLGLKFFTRNNCMINIYTKLRDRNAEIKSKEFNFSTLHQYDLVSLMNSNSKLYICIHIKLNIGKEKFKGFMFSTKRNDGTK